MRACFGRRDELLEEGRSVAARWCSACSKAHPGAEDVVSRRCEDCKARPLPMASVRVAPDSPPARFVLRSVTDGCTAPATRVSSAGDPPALCASDREHVTVVRQLRARTPWSHQRGFTTLRGLQHPDEMFRCATRPHVSLPADGPASAEGHTHSTACEHGSVTCFLAVQDCPAVSRRTHAGASGVPSRTRRPSRSHHHGQIRSRSCAKTAATSAPTGSRCPPPSQTCATAAAAGASSDDRAGSLALTIAPASPVLATPRLLSLALRRVHAGVCRIRPA